ncbi:hypothetical protein [Caballeronia terrestris]|jgi:hypothetical protein|uniref:hypothetical protein n=1 Tax=Caballeronia terrestris TaxID=1226301 RepID=UPI000F73DF08|nr:hypothetical protein [Caballeronia terrestris]
MTSTLTLRSIHPKLGGIREPDAAVHVAATATRAPLHRSNRKCFRHQHHCSGQIAMNAVSFRQALPPAR